MKNLRIFIPIGVTVIINFLIGYILQIESSMIIKVLIYCILFELSCFLLSYRGVKYEISFSRTIQKFKKFINLTKIFQIIMILYIVYRILIGTGAELLFFYCHVLIVFYAIGYILCLNNQEFNKKES